MEFCPECGSMMTPEAEVWVCGSCGHERARDAEREAAMATTTEREETEVVDLTEVSPEDSGRPTTSVRCPDCGNDTAYWQLRQIRSADESETRFFECTECGHRWREDDH